MKKVVILLTVFLSISLVTVAQTDKKSLKKEAQKPMYTCPMHPEVISDKKGKCPKCGMDLVPMEKKDFQKGMKAGMHMNDSVHKEMYACPMHPKEMSDEEGKCSKCGMDLTQMKGMHMDKKEGINMNDSIQKQIYTCPMHSKEMSDTKGKCPKCGMDMKEKSMGKKQ